MIVAVQSMPSGPPAEAYTKKYAYDVDGNLLYEGWAKARLNAEEAAAVWAIQKSTVDANGNVTLTQWADGNTAEDNVWTDRATLTYQ